MRADGCSRSWLAEGRARGPVFSSSRVRRGAQGAAGWPRGAYPVAGPRWQLGLVAELRSLETEPLPKREVGGGWLWARPASERARSLAEGGGRWTEPRPVLGSEGHQAPRSASSCCAQVARPAYPKGPSAK